MKGRGDDEPTVRSASPAAKTKGNPKVGESSKAGDPFAFWDKEFKGHKTRPAELFGYVAELIQTKQLEQYKNAEAAIKKFIAYNPTAAEPWMYEFLVKTIEARKGPDAEVKDAISYGAMLAKRTKNPNDLVRVADMMAVRNFIGPVGRPGYETNIGELVDLAAQQVPTNAIPPMMSVNLAAKTKDPKRMAVAAEQILALGWPGIDDTLRRNLAEQVEGLVKALRDDARSDDAEALAQKVADSEGRDVYVALKWSGEGDLDLAVAEPLLTTAQYKTPRTVGGGAILKNGYGKHPEEVYVCPRGFDGDYTIRVETIFNDEAKPVRDATLTVITHEGRQGEERRESKVDLARPTPVVVHLAGGRRKEVLPFIPPPEPTSLVPKSPTRGPAAKPAASPPARGSSPAPIR